MAGGGMLTPPRGLGGQTDLIAQRMAPPVGSVMGGQDLPPGADQLLAPTRGGIGHGRAMPLGGAAPLGGGPAWFNTGRVGGNMLGDPSMGPQSGGAGMGAALPPRVGGNMLGDPSMAPAGGAGMGAPAGLSPEVLAMIKAALGGQRPPGLTQGPAPSLQAGAAMGGPDLAQAIQGMEVLGGGGELPPEVQARVAEAGRRQAAPAPQRPQPAPTAPPPGMPTAPQLQDPRIAASMNRVLGPIPGGFAGGASPELQRRWALHAQNLQEGTQR